MSDKISVVIVDDHPLFRAGLRRVIETDPQVEVLGEAGDGQCALPLIRALKPDIAIVDIAMPVLDGFGLVRAVQKEDISVAVIFLTMYSGGQGILKTALDLDAKGYVVKDSAALEIVNCIKAVASGQHFTSPSVTTSLICNARRAETTSAKDSGPGGRLSRCELRVLGLIAEYKTSREIADALCISCRTVETHRTNICQKVGLHGSHALMKFALEGNAVPFKQPPNNYVAS